ncbi:Gibberellin-regulated protein 2 [Zea mays]|uniref:Gibberellin-regulated protein 2 n=1 Tax=Zea mays TaxID=4577 RepID=A0A1D6DTL9_MAIZE|nr:Gibberellin-regulated protein 2 [Zea mays]
MAAASGRAPSACALLLLFLLLVVGAAAAAVIVVDANRGEQEQDWDWEQLSAASPSPWSPAPAPAPSPVSCRLRERVRGAVRAVVAVEPVPEGVRVLLRPLQLRAAGHRREPRRLPLLRRHHHPRARRLSSCLVYRALAVYYPM